MRRVRYVLRGAAGSISKMAEISRSFLQHEATRSAPISRGRCSNYSIEISVLAVAGELGFEPRLTESESAVLPLDDSPPGG